MSCADIGPFEGGVYNDPKINNPDVDGGTLTSPTINGIVNLDTAAARSLLEAPQEISPVAVTDNPKQSEATDVPTIIVGEDRTVILGKPFKWIKCGDGMIPVFRKE